MSETSEKGRRTKQSSLKKKSSIPYFSIAHIAGDVVALGGMGFFFYTRTSKLQTEVDKVRVDLVNFAKYISLLEDKQLGVVNSGQDKVDQIIAQHNNFLRDMTGVKQWANVADARLKKVEEQQKELMKSATELIQTVNDLVASVERMERLVSGSSSSRGRQSRRQVDPYDGREAENSESPPRRRTSRHHNDDEELSGSEVEAKSRGRGKQRKSFSMGDMDLSGASIKERAAAARRATKNSETDGDDLDAGDSRHSRGSDTETPPKRKPARKPKKPVEKHGEDPV